MRKLWVAAAAAWLMGAAGTSRAAEPEQVTRPNFLLVYLDDQRYDAMGVVQREQGERGRFPWLKTPNMDRLAEQGMRFRNAFVVNSLCSPSRACFLSGQYSHVNGVVNNHTPFPEDTLTSSGLLKEAGYATAYIGKWHHGHQKERPGFEYIASYLGQGVYRNCRFNINGTMTPTQGWVDDVATDLTINYLRQHVEEGKKRPFNIVLGFKTPHQPRLPAEPDRKLYAGETARPVPNLAVKAPFRDTEAMEKGEDRALRQSADPEGFLDYFRGITSTDRSLGRLMDALEELGLAEDTVLIFTSDNGYYFGEHGLGDKRSAYEESIRIPLLVRYPRGGQKGVTTDVLATNVDLAPTLLDLAGVPVPAEMHGRSWGKVLAGKADALREAFFYSYFYENRYGTPTTLAVRTADAKLIKYPGHDEWTELFDLAADPYEMKNLWSDPAARTLRQRMEAEFDRQAKAIDFEIPEYADQPEAPEPGGRSGGTRVR